MESTHLWHERFGHINYPFITKFINKELVRDIPKINAKIEGVCGACQKGKQTKVHHKSSRDILTKAPLDLIHMDLFGPIQQPTVAGKKYPCYTSPGTCISFVYNKLSSI